MSRPPANRHARRSARVRRLRTRALATTGAVGLLLPVATTTSLADTYDESIDGENYHLFTPREVTLFSDGGTRGDGGQNDGDGGQGEELLQGGGDGGATHSGDPGDASA